MVIPTIFGAFRGGPKAEKPQFSAEKRNKILLVKQAERMGNIILMNSAISGLAAAFENLEIDLLLPAPYADIMAANSHINRIIPVLKREYIIRPWLLAELISRLRREKYDLAIDCSDVNSHSSTGASYAILSGARITAGWKMTNRQIFDIEIERYQEVVHATEMYVRLFSGIFGRSVDGDPYFDKVEAAGNLAEPVIGINCGGRGPKRWPLDKFIELGKIISRKGTGVEFILGPEVDGLRAELEKSLPDGCRLLPLMYAQDLMKKISGYKAFISSDTGPMHLAWCLKVPTVAIFLDSELEKFRPLSPGSAAIDGKKGIAPEKIAEIAAGILESGKVRA